MRFHETRRSTYGITEDEEVDEGDEEEEEEELVVEEEEEEVSVARGAGAGVVDVGEGVEVCVVEVSCTGVDEKVLDVEGRVREGVLLGVAEGVVTSGGTEVVVGLGGDEGDVLVGAGEVGVGDPPWSNFGMSMTSV